MASLAGSIPLNLNVNPVYQDAVDHAKDAFFIQSGLQGYYSNVEDYFKKQALMKLDSLGWTEEFKILAGSYFIYRRRSITFPIKNQWEMTVYQYGTGLTIHF